MRISTDFSTPQNPRQAFSFIAKDFFENHQKWDPDLVENIKLTKGPIGAGTKGRSVTKFAGKQVADFEITEYSPEKSFVFINTTGPVLLERGYFFKPLSAGGTRVNFIFDMRPKTLPMKIVFPIISRLTAKRVHKNIKILESLLN